MADDKSTLIRSLIQARYGVDVDPKRAMVVGALSLILVAGIAGFAAYFGWQGAARIAKRFS